MDEETLQFYRSNAEAYARREIAAHTRLTRFLALLPPGAAILELGCGAGAVVKFVDMVPANNLARAVAARQIQNH